MAHSRIADLSVDEFKDLIREALTQAMVEILGDSDEGLELREDIKAALQRSVEADQAGGDTIPAETVAAKLGLEW